MMEEFFKISKDCEFTNAEEMDDSDQIFQKIRTSDQFLVEAFAMELGSSILHNS